MTSLDKIERASTATPTSAVVPGRHLAIELAETLKLGVPIALTQLGQIAMMTTDLAMIGRLGAEAVAAAALAHTVLFVSFTFGMGLVSAVAPLAAQAFGARNPHRDPPRAARRPVGRAHDFAAADGAAVLGRADPADAGPDASDGASCAGISRRPGLDHPSGAVVHGDPRLHERDQPPGAGALDHAGCDPRQRAAGLHPAVRRVRPAAARPVRRGAGNLHRQFRHVPGCRMVCHVPPAVPEVSRVRPFLADRLAADVAAARHRRADLALLPARIRPVRRRRPIDGPDQHDLARRAPDRVCRSPPSCTWCRSASAWPRPCGLATPSAAATPARSGVPAMSPPGSVSCSLPS